MNRPKVALFADPTGEWRRYADYLEREIMRDNYSQIETCDKCSLPVRWNDELGWCDAETGEPSNCAYGHSHHVAPY